MDKSKRIAILSVAAAFAGAVSTAAVISAPTDALAAGKVKCYGIAKAGENDCANKAGTHSCAGHSTMDFDGGDWKVTNSDAECMDMGGKTEPFDGMNPMKS